MIAITSLDPTSLAESALICLLLQKPMTLVLAPDYQRKGMPLPIKRMPVNEDGTTTQSYRPMVILEYVQEALSGELAKRQLLDKRAEQSLSEALQADMCP